VLLVDQFLRVCLAGFCRFRFAEPGLLLQYWLGRYCYYARESASVAPQIAMVL